MSTIAYRHEIDGLRGIAVIAAICWHAQFNILGIDPVPGGFMGIEIFFVISGYLITLIILREMQQDRFTIRGFYERRARRILPMLLTVMLASLPFAWLYMLPKAVEEFTGSALSMLAFGSNFYFWQESSYWSEAAELKPLLHTWSLSVEEQFYVLFPLLLIVLWKLGVQYIIPVFLLIFVGSLTLTQVSVASDPEGTFFLLLPRMWELVAGALLAVLEMNNGRTSHPKLESIMPWVGLVLVCAPIFVYHRDLEWPSLLTAVPVVGTMMVIWYTKPEHSASRLLRWKPIAGVGLVSYSFYLWHFPIFAFARVKGPWPSQSDMAIYILLAFSLSVLTYHFIEKPFRSRRVIALPAFVPIILVATVAVFAVSAYGYVNKGFWGRYTDGQIQMLGVGENRDSYVDYVLRYAKTTRTTDEFSDPDEGNDLFVIGDSYSADFLNALNEGGFLEGLEVLGYKISWDCLNVPESSDYKEFLKPKDVDKCVGAVRVGHPDLASRIQEADFVLLASSWMDYTTSQLDELLAAVESQTDVPVLIVGRKQFGRLNAQELASYTEQEFLSRRQKDETRLKWMKAVPESVKGNYLDIHRLFCGDNDDCPIATPEGRLISYDGSHLTRDGAVHLSRLLSSDEDFTRRWEAAFGDYMCPEIRDEGVPCPIGIYADDAKIEPYSGPKDKLHIYLLIGQSNMAGRAFFAPEESEVIERSYVLNGDGNWESAKNPLNRYSTIRKGLDKQKMNPGYMFAKTMIEKDKDVSIGLVVNARADTKISQWAKGTEFYNDALKRVETARKTGVLKGVLWHQGESDAKNAEYLDQLKSFIADLRKDLKEPNLPFVAGQVNNIKLINDQIAELPENVPYTGFVSSKGLKTTDNWHFDAKSIKLLGKRYALVMQKLVNSEQKESSKTK